MGIKNILEVIAMNENPEVRTACALFVETGRAYGFNRRAMLNLFNEFFAGEEEETTVQDVQEPSKDDEKEMSERKYEEQASRVVQKMSLTVEERQSLVKILMIIKDDPNPLKRRVASRLAKVSVLTEEEALPFIEKVLETVSKWLTKQHFYAYIHPVSMDNLKDLQAYIEGQS